MSADDPVVVEDWNRTPPAIQAMLIASWTQVQTLQVQVEALRVEVAWLRKRLEQVSSEITSPAVKDPSSVSYGPRESQSEYDLSVRQETVEHGLVPSNPIDRITEATSADVDRGEASSPGEQRAMTGSPMVKTLRAECKVDPSESQESESGLWARLSWAFPDGFLGVLRKVMCSLPQRRSRHVVVERLAVTLAPYAWLGIIAWLVGTYVLVNFVLHRVLSPGLNIYVVQPFLWSCLAVQSLLYWRYGLEDRPACGKPLVASAILIGAFQVALRIFAGLLFGFGRSPYGRRFLVLLGNIVYAGTMLVGMEMSRACLVAAFSRRHPLLAISLLSLLFSFISTPFAKFGALNSATAAFRVSGEMFLPTISQNLLASFLVLVGGPVASIGYRGVPIVFEWLSAVLPRLEWFVSALLGALVPVAGLMAIYQRFFAGPIAEVEHRPHRPQRGRSAAGWVLVGMMTVVLLGLNTGLLGVHPSLIASGSMQPELLVGDVVITRDVPPEDVKVGDIVRFRRDDVYIIHRVIDIQRDEHGITFITRGDDNNVEDPPVVASDLAGKVILTVPKIGWISIGLRKLIGFA